MDENETQQNNLLDTTDCLEAVGVFRGWKNALFVIVIICLLLLQVSFWLVDTGYVKAETTTAKATTPALEPPSATEPAPEVWPPPAKNLVKPLKNDSNEQSAAKAVEIEQAAEQAAEEVAEEPNKSPETKPQTAQAKAGFLSFIDFSHLSWLIRFVNGLLILSAVLYCLSMLFGLKVSLVGRLGGINHISRAFFLSLVMLIILLPWQVVFDGVIAGVLYTPYELLERCSAERSGIFATTLHYLRFTGYWLLAVLFLIFTQVRSGRWTRSVLRRLEVV